MKRLHVLFLGSLMAFTVVKPLSLHAQETEAKALQTYTVADPGEKLFVHLSRTDLITGELLWFSVFVADRQSHRPLDMSKIAYAELIGPGGTAVLQTRVFLNRGAGYGSFYLPANLQSGEYLFRAYTAWMKNIDPAFWFSQPVKILNTLRPAENIPMPPVSQAPIVSFFPEGGQLVDGLESRVAFHATDRFGNGVTLKGWVLDGRDTVVRFSPIRNGLGSFQFRPVAGKSYKAQIRDAKGKVVPVTLPAINAEGIVLNVRDTTAGRMFIGVRGKAAGESVSIVIHTRQQINFSGKAWIASGNGGVLIEGSIFPAGITHITVFSSAGQPLAERLVFRKPAKAAVTISTNQRAYNVRSRAQLTFPVPDAATRYSVSVFRADSIAPASDIVTNLLLTSDLHGKVETPEFYLSDDPLSTPLADLLMLTHGWRRFNWESVLAGRKPTITYLPEINGHLIQGTLLDADDKAVAGKTVFMSSPSKIIRLFTAQSDAEGKVRFDISARDLGNKVIIQPDLARDSLLRLRMDDPFSTMSSQWKPRPAMTYGTMAAGLVERNVAMQVQDVFHEDETYFNYPAGVLDSIPFYGKATESYDLDDYVRFPEMEEIMREFVKGVWVRKKRDRFRLVVTDGLRNIAFSENPLTLLDGVPIPDINRLFSVDAVKIDKIEVLSRKYFLGPLKCSGIVSLSSYAGDLAGMQPDPRSVVIDYAALEKQRQFHTTQYATVQSRESRIPDRRHLVLFNPEFRAAKGERAVLEFFTSDVEGRFQVVVEGLSETGQPVHGVTTFSVSRD
ncbi:MAG: hypothetical protein ACKORJ_12750 [Bacteroidota bacterium]